MQDFLNNFKNLVKCEEIRTDNNVFKLHYKFSVILLIVFSILLSSKQYFGDPIDCDVDYKKDIVNVFCWATGTFILVDNVNDRFSSYGGMERLGNEAGKETYALLYYQWVCLLFSIQALLFYIPRYLWKSWEGDRLGQMVKDLCGPLLSDKWSVAYKEKMITYITNNENHDIFAYRFAFCEFLNLCNLICQTVLMDWYLNGKFSRYGYEVATKPWPVAYNAVFPKRTKCRYPKSGPSGTIENKDALCILPLNVLNEKFFLILWYWMIFMFVATIGALIYRIMVISWQQFRAYLLMAQVRSLSRKKVETIGKHLSHGQFFLLYNMGKKMNPITYKELLLSIFENLEIKVVNQNMEGAGAYGGGKAGGAFDPISFAQRPTVLLRAICWLFSVIVFGCISSQGWQPNKDKKVTCLYNDDTNACNYGVGISVIAFLASMGFLVGEYLFEQMSSVKTRKHYVLADLGFSAFWAFLYFVGFWYLCSQWSKSDEPASGIGVSNVRAAIAFCFFSIFSWAASAFLAFQRFKQGGEAAFSTNFESDNMQSSYPSYPGGPDTDQHYQEPPFSTGPNARGPTEFQAPAY